MKPVDLISVASQRGLLDETSARERLGDKPATIDRLVDLGLLRLNDAPKLLDTYHARVAASTGPARCGRCAQPMTRRDSSIVCDPCGISVSFETPSRYTKIKELGSGGFGSVWLARDEHHNRLVALKFLTNVTDEDLARFKREAVLAASLSHPNIAPVYEFSLDPPFIAMQFVEGQTADAFTGKSRDAARIIRDAARAVHAAHRRGIIHRDLKPQNLMVDARGRVFVMDFGLAKRLDADSSLSQSGLIIGTPHFMSPEQASGAALDARSDVYSLGVTLYALASGRLPFEGTQMEVLRAVVNDDPPPPRTDADLAVIVGKAMRKEPDHRYATADALADDLERFLNNEAIAARPASVAYRLRKRVAKNPWAWTLAATALLAVAVAGVAFSLRSRTFEQKSRAKAAIAEAENALRRWRDEARYPLHDVAPARQELSKAVSALQSALRLEPESHEAKALLGYALFELGDYDRSMDHLSAAIAAAPDRPRYHWWRHLALRERAVQMLAKADAVESEQTAAYLRERAGVLEKEMRIHLRSAVDLGRRAPFEEWRLADARTCDSDSDRRAALEAVAVAGSPIAPEAYLMLSREFSTLQRPKEAMTSAESALALAPSHLKAYLSAASLRRDQAKALQDAGAPFEEVEASALEGLAFASKATQTDPSSADAWTSRALLRLRLAYFKKHYGKETLSDFIEALDVETQRAIELQPDLPDAWDMRGLARMAVGHIKRARGEDPKADYREAIDVDYTRAVQLQRRSVDARINRADARVALAAHLLKTGDDPQPHYQAMIEQDLDPASKLDPDSSVVWKTLAEARMFWAAYRIPRGLDPTELLQEAIEVDFPRAMKLAPEDFDLLDSFIGSKGMWASHLDNIGKDPSRIYEQLLLDDLAAALRKYPGNQTLLTTRCWVINDYATWKFKMGKDPRREMFDVLDGDVKTLTEAAPDDVWHWRLAALVRINLAEFMEKFGEDPRTVLRHAIDVDLARAFELSPENSKPWTYLGTAHARVAVHERAKESADAADAAFEAAERCFSAGLKADDEPITLYIQRGLLRKAFGRTSEALEDLRHAVALTPVLPPDARAALNELESRSSNP